MRRKGLGKGMGTGYKNLLPMDSHIHSLNARGVKSRQLLYAKTTLKDITSTDLDYWTLGDQAKGILEDFSKERRDKINEGIKTIKKNSNLFKVGDFFDWKEEKAMWKAISQELSKGKFKYAYNAYPDGDGYSVVYSKVKLPNAEEII